MKGVFNMDLIHDMIISPELVRSIIRQFLLWFWCCVPVAYVWSLFNIDYFEGGE